MRVLPTLFLATIAIAGLSGRAAAQSAPGPSAADKALAKQYVDSGMQAQDAGDYDAAIADYDKAYHVMAHPVLLFDKAQAYRLAGKTDLAIAFYTRYLAEDPDGLKAQDARALLSDLQASAAGKLHRTDPARPAGADDGPGAAAPARVADEVTPSPGAAPPDAPGFAVAAGSPGAAEPGDVDPERHLRWAGITTIGVGAASLAIGAGFGLHARSLSDEVSRQYDAAKDRAGRRANTIEITGLVAGAGLVAAGSALCWWAHRRAGRTTQISIAPAVSEHLTGLAIAGVL